MGLSAPWEESFDVIALQPLKNWPGINPIGLSIPWANSLGIINFKTAKIN